MAERIDVVARTPGSRFDHFDKLLIEPGAARDHQWRTEVNDEVYVTVLRDTTRYR